MFTFKHNELQIRLTKEGMFHAEDVSGKTVFRFVLTGWLFAQHRHVDIIQDGKIQARLTCWPIERFGFSNIRFYKEQLGIDEEEHIGQLHVKDLVTMTMPQSGILSRGGKEIELENRNKYHICAACCSSNYADPVGLVENPSMSSFAFADSLSKLNIEWYGGDRTISCCSHLFPAIGERILEIFLPSLQFLVEDCPIERGLFTGKVRIDRDGIRLISQEEMGRYPNDLECLHVYMPWSMQMREVTLDKQVMLVTKDSK